jgi:hypothetical protein
MNKEVEGFFIKNKKGSHVGMIISFIVFITFVVFVLVVLKPAINIGEGRQVTLEDTKSKIMENVSANYTTASINFEDARNPNRRCVTFQGIIAILGIMPPYKVMIKNESGSLQKSYLYDPTIADIEVNRDDRDNVFFKLYESPRFASLTSNTTIRCDTLNSTYYEIGSVYSGKYVFESAVKELIKEYNQHYEDVKTELKISSANDFSFSLTLSNGSRIEGVKNINAKNIYAQETPIQYVDENANIQSGYIIVKIW